MDLETDANGQVTLGSLFKLVAFATFVFNWVVIFPALAVALLINGATPNRMPAIPDGAGDVPTLVAVVTIVPILVSFAGAVAGIQNAVVVCVGVWIQRAWRHWRAGRSRSARA